MLFILILKTSGLLNLALKAFGANDNKVVKNSISEANKTIKNLFKSTKSKINKSKNFTNIYAIEKTIFPTLNTRIAFNYLKKMFIKA